MTHVPPSLEEQLRELRQRVFDLERRRMPGNDEFWIVHGKVVTPGDAAFSGMTAVGFGPVRFPNEPLPFVTPVGAVNFTTTSNVGCEFEFTTTDGLYTGANLRVWKNVTAAVTFSWAVMGFV